MNAFVTALYRDLTCAAAAAVISLIVAASFVESTAVVPGSPVAAHTITVPAGEQA